MSPRSRVEDVSTPTPGELGFVMPIETARHDACWMAWPHDGHADAWGDDLADVQRCFIGIASAISAFEPVRVVADPGVAVTARAALPGNIDVVSLPQDDLWFRDTGPLFVVHADGAMIGSTFVFNSWGGKFPDFARDATIGERLVSHLGL